MKNELTIYKPEQSNNIVSISAPNMSCEVVCDTVEYFGDMVKLNNVKTRIVAESKIENIKQISEWRNNLYERLFNVKY